MEQRTSNNAGYQPFMDDEADLFRAELQEALADSMALDIQPQKIGAIVVDDDSTDGYYLVQWIGLPYTCQETGDLLCEGRYLNPVPRAKLWYTQSDLAPDIHNVKHVVFADIQMEKVSDSNPLPRTCDVSTATGKGAMKISVDEHHLILEEITRRGSLEDPNYDSAGSEDSEDSNNSSGSEE